MSYLRDVPDRSTSIRAGWFTAVSRSTMIDNAAGGAANTLRPAGALIGTIETKANLVRPIMTDSGPVRATGQVISAGRRIIVSEARLVDAEADCSRTARQR